MIARNWSGSVIPGNADRADWFATLRPHYSHARSGPKELSAKCREVTSALEDRAKPPTLVVSNGFEFLARFRTIFSKMAMITTTGIIPAIPNRPSSIHMADTHGALPQGKTRAGGLG